DAHALGIPFVEGSIDGPLPAGTVVESHGLTVTQTDERHAEIVYGESLVRLAVDPGESCSYSVGLPIAAPPSAQRPAIGLVGSGPDRGAPAPPPLAQRLVLVVSTANAVAEQRIDERARVAPLAVQTRIAGSREVAETGASTTGLADVQEFTGDGYAQL